MEKLSKYPLRISSDVREQMQYYRALFSDYKSALELRIQAVAKIGVDVEVEYITDMEKVMSYGVMSMPALVVNEKVVSAGKVLKASEIEKLL